MWAAMQLRHFLLKPPEGVLPKNSRVCGKVPPQPRQVDDAFISAPRGQSLSFRRKRIPAKDLASGSLERISESCPNGSDRQQARRRACLRYCHDPARAVFAFEPPGESEVAFVTGDALPVDAAQRA